MRKIIFSGLLTLAACAPEQKTVNGKAAFMSQCAACHGDGGAGNGPAAAGLTPPPANLTTIAARNGGVFPSDRVMSAIDGFNRGQHFSDAMPRFGDGDMGPLVMTAEDGNPVPVPAELLALSNYLESIQR